MHSSSRRNPASAEYLYKAPVGGSLKNLPNQRELVYLLKSLSSLKHHSHKSSSSARSSHPCSLLILRGASRGNRLHLQTQHCDNGNCPLSNAYLALPWQDASHKLQVPQYMPTTCQLQLLTFGEGGEFSSCLHNHHLVILKSSPLLNSQIMMTDQGRNLAATVDVNLTDWELKEIQRKFPPWSLEIMQEVGTSPLTCRKCVVERWMVLTSCIPCLEDFSLCTTKFKELQVVGKKLCRFFLLFIPIIFNLL